MRAGRHALTLGLAALVAACAPTPPPPAAAPSTPSPSTAAPAAAPAPRPDAPRIDGVDLGTAVDSRQRVVQPMVSFAPTDTIHAGIRFDGADRSAAHRIGVRWDFGPTDQPVLAESKILAIVGPGATAFSIRKPDGWPPGRYRLRVLLDGVVVQARQFDVIAPAPVGPVVVAPAPPTPNP